MSIPQLLQKHLPKDQTTTVVAKDTFADSYYGCHQVIGALLKYLILKCIFPN